MLMRLALRKEIIIKEHNCKKISAYHPELNHNLTSYDDFSTLIALNLPLLIIIIAWLLK